MLVWALVDRKNRKEYADMRRFFVVHNDANTVEICELRSDVTTSFVVKKEVFEEFFTACRNTKTVRITGEELGGEKDGDLS